MAAHWFTLLGWKLLAELSYGISDKQLLKHHSVPMSWAVKSAATGQTNRTFPSSLCRGNIILKRFFIHRGAGIPVWLEWLQNSFFQKVNVKSCVSKVRSVILSKNVFWKGWTRFREMFLFTLLLLDFILCPFIFFSSSGPTFSSSVISSYLLSSAVSWSPLFSPSLIPWSSWTVI